MKKRLPASVLALAMCLTFLQPVVGLAVSDEGASAVIAWEWVCGEGQQGPVLNKESGQWELTVSIRNGELPSAEKLEALLPTAISATVVSTDTGDTEETGVQEDGPQPDDASEPTAGEDSADGSSQEPEPSISGEDEDSSGVPEGDDGDPDPMEPVESGGFDHAGDEVEPPKSDAVTDGGETPEAGAADTGEGSRSVNPGKGDGASAPNGESLPSGDPEENGGKDSEPAGTSAPGTSLPGREEDADTPDMSNPPLANDGEDGTDGPGEDPDEPGEPATETEQLKLTWDLKNYPGKTSAADDVPASCNLTAKLPAGYALSEDAPELTLTVIFSETKPAPATAEDLNAHTVEGVMMPGTVVNMFDYWLGETRYNGNEGNPTKYSDNQHTKELGERVHEHGINKNKTLIFSNGSENGQDHRDSRNSYNCWYSEKPYAPFSYRESNKEKKELVTRVLPEDGYPAIRLNWSNEIKEEPQSLAYLFDPENTEHLSYKKAFPNVTGLFQIDKDGYYYYDSKENYAHLDESTGDIILYDAPGVYDGSEEKSGQFFPFDDPLEQEIFLVDNGELVMNEQVQPRANSPLNHYFGLTMTTRFKQINGGTTWKGEPITYEFTGDDDVWLYIDDVLIADLGGLHNSVSLTVDFESGKILVYSTEFPVDSSNAKVFLDTTIKAQFEAAGKKLSEGAWSGNTFADNTYHTLKFFYLERGNSASNLKLRFNLHPIPESELLKVDQGDKGIPKAGFALYKSNDKYECIGDPLYTGTTDGEGRLPLKDKTGAPISFQQLAEEHNTNYFVLKETKVPTGYRQPAEVRLHLENGVIFSEDSWSTGTYAQAKVTTTASSKVNYEGGTLNLADLGTELEDTVMFAVILKRVDMSKEISDEKNWVPVYGDALNGWHVMEDSSWDSVLRAAAENPYLFHVASNGSFQVEIDDLPGDVKEYYSMLGEGEKGNARYTVAYYYTTAENLQGATEANTYRLETDDFLREFSVKLFIPNPRNRLVVQKVDDGHPLSGAEFALYAVEDIAVENDGTYEIKGNAEPYDTVTTADLTKESGSWLELEGAGVFPTGDKDLENGTYYLVETVAPDGYEVNPVAVKVIVNDTGVYADAGSEDDGVSVQRGVGRLMRSMLQFAANDDIDATLHDVKAQLLTTSNESPTEAMDWTEWKTENADELHLRYDSADETLAYVPADGFMEEYLSTETGWSKLEIRQCLAHDDDLDGAYKQNLGKQDLANLFSGVVIVQVEDRKTSVGTSALNVTKHVTGTGADTSQSFDFTVTVERELNGWYGDMFFKNGTAAFALSNGETMTATGLPDGTGYTVTETNAEGYTVNYSNQTGTLKNNVTTEVTVTNTKETPTPEPEPETGTLTVSKIVMDEAGEYLPDDTAEFHFEITLTGADNKPINGNFSYTGGTVQGVSGVIAPDGGTLEFENGTASITLKHGQTITINDLPAGAAYQVEELDADGYKVTSEDAAGTIPAEGTVTAAFTNTRNDDPGPDPDPDPTPGPDPDPDPTPDPDPDPGAPVGNLKLSKTVRGDDRDGTFTFRVTFTTKAGDEITARFYYNGDETGTIGSGETVTLADGESITIRNIPAGTHYQVEELNAEGYDVISSGETGSITESKTAQASFVNTWNDTPNQPTDPEDPSDPDIPPDPDIPDDPNGPNTPDGPDDPSTPDYPDEPGTPDDPGQPDEPDAPNDPGTPKTDDPRHTSLWIALCLLSLGGMGVLAFTRNGIKRKKR